MERGDDHSSSSEFVDVLVVDDNEDVRTSCASILSGAGYSVGTAANGAVALQFLKSTDTGVVLLDLKMPVLDGYRVLDLLDEPPPVVLLTARNYDSEVVARRDKVFLYLQKPIHPNDLLEAVALALVGRRHSA